MEVVEIEGKVDTLQTLPKTEDQIDISLIEGWEEVTEKQQYFLYLYFLNFPRKTYTRMQANVTDKKLNSWLKQDHEFKFIYDEIENLHKENLVALQYRDAMTNPTVRKDVLKSLGVSGYETKQSNNTTNVLNVDKKSLPEIMKGLKQQ